MRIIFECQLGCIAGCHILSFGRSHGISIHIEGSGVVAGCNRIGNDILSLHKCLERVVDRCLGRNIIRSDIESRCDLKTNVVGGIAIEFDGLLHRDIPVPKNRQLVGLCVLINRERVFALGIGSISIDNIAGDERYGLSLNSLTLLVANHSGEYRWL